MRRWVPLLLVLLASAPLAAADVTYSGNLGTNAQNAPQIHCELVQSAPRPASDPLACNQSGAARGITLLRVRGTGVGSMYAVLHDNVRSTQLATLDCSTAGVVECKQAFSTLGVTSGQVSLHGRAYGGGGASWVITVERVPADAPVRP